MGPVIVKDHAWNEEINLGKTFKLLFFMLFTFPVSRWVHKPRINRRPRRNRPGPAWRTAVWPQIRNDDGGKPINTRGGLLEEGMLPEGTIHYAANGTTAGFRGLWNELADGRVRRFFERSSGEGVTWNTWFEGFSPESWRIWSPARAVNEIFFRQQRISGR